MINRIPNENELKEIESYFLRKYGQLCVLDGVICPEKFYQTIPRILWILKDANVLRLGQIRPDFSDLREALSEVSVCNQLKGFATTYTKVVLASYEILKKTEKNLPCSCQEILPRIAIINVKKQAGTKRVTGTEIHTFYKADKEMLHKQIEAISPDIIINASRNTDLFSTLSEDSARIQVGPFQVAQRTDTKRIIIHAYHPGYAFKTQLYVELIKQCLAHCGI